MEFQSIRFMQSSNQAEQEYSVRSRRSSAGKAGEAAQSFNEILSDAEEASRSNAGGASGAKSTLSEEDLPLEAYALPEWAESWCSPLIEVSQELGSNSSWADPRRDRLNSREEDELMEYTKIVHSCFSQGLKNNGINGPVEYYTDLLLNPEMSEKVHQEVRAMLASDPRAMELMEKFHASLD